MSDFSRRDFIKKSILLSLGASYIISCEDNDMLDSDTESNSSDESDNNILLLINSRLEKSDIFTFFQGHLSQELIIHLLK